MPYHTDTIPPTHRPRSVQECSVACPFGHSLGTGAGAGAGVVEVIACALPVVDVIVPFDGTGPRGIAMHQLLDVQIMCKGVR